MSDKKREFKDLAIYESYDFLNKEITGYLLDIVAARK
jgi:hypothetical protein